MSSIFAKLVSESMLSMYPTFVKNIDVPFNYLLWSRMVVNVIISSLFVNWNVILKYIFNWRGWMLAILTLIDNYAAFKGIKILESGVAISIIYMYPIFIVLFTNGGYFKYVLLLISFIGMLLLVNEIKKENFKDNIETIKGIIYVCIVVISATALYFNIRMIDTDNPWNHMFLSYILGAIITTMFFKKYITEYDYTDKKYFITFAFNAIVGVAAHYLRMFSVIRLKPVIYASLSYFAVLMGYIYGLTFNNEKITLQKIIGSLLIIISNIVAVIKYR
jgi:drug/metabolite transporter (DMT)-like permease